MDIERYAADRLVVDPLGRVPAQDLYDDYRAWVKTKSTTLGDVGYATIHQFGRAVVRYGIPRNRDRHGRYYSGIRLRTTDRDPSAGEG